MYDWMDACMNIWVDKDTHWVTHGRSHIQTYRYIRKWMDRIPVGAQALLSDSHN